MTLQARTASADVATAAATLPTTEPRTRFTAETEADFYRRRKKSVAIRHISGDRVVAVVEIAAIWEEIGGEPFKLPSDQRLTMASYECNAATRAFIEPLAVGDRLPDIPLFLEPNGCIVVPLELTYMAAYNVMPKRWRDVLETRIGAGRGAEYN